MTSDTAKKYQVNDEGFLVASPTYQAFCSIRDPNENILPEWYTNLHLASIQAFQEPKLQLTPIYGVQAKPTIEEQYNKMQEEVSKLTGIVGDVQKELVETRKENEELKRELSAVTKKKRIKIKEVRRSEVKKLNNRVDRLNKKFNDFGKEYHEGMEKDMPLVRHVSLALKAMEREEQKRMEEESNGN